MTANKLSLKWLGVDAQQEHIIFMRNDCHVCRAEGFGALSRVVVRHEGKSIVATINTISSDLLSIDEASLTKNAWETLGAQEGNLVTVEHLSPIDSFNKVRAKLYGEALSQKDYQKIINDIKERKYSNIQISAFISACVGDRMSLEETKYLTHAMIEVGNKINWEQEIVVDKHSVGGLPGNRTTPIVVAIVAAAGLTIPKTSSRAITSPSGTADAMETLTPVDLSLETLKKVVRKEGGCIAWGGSVNLSPTDDILIKVERAIDIDSKGQMIASVLSKKAAAGSTHVILDIPIGPTVKVRSKEAALDLKNSLIEVGKSLNLEVAVLFSDGTQPVGKGIGPALEARDVLAVLDRSQHAPKDLEEKSVLIAGAILEMVNKCEPGEGNLIASELLNSGKAKEKFLAICKLQGGFKEPPKAKCTHDILASHSGTVIFVDNRKLSRVAKLAGAPNDPAAGIEYFAKLGMKVKKGEILYRIHTETPGELEYALSYVQSQTRIIEISE